MRMRIFLSILLFVLLAPSLNLDVVENLAEHAPEQSFQIRILQISQATNAFFLISLQKGSHAISRIQFSVKSLNIRRRDATRPSTLPDRSQGFLLGILRLLVRYGQYQTRT